MSRYIINLPDLTTERMTQLYKEGVRAVDAALGDDNFTTLSATQIQFVGKLLTRRGVDVDTLLDEVLRCKL